MSLPRKNKSPWKEKKKNPEEKEPHPVPSNTYPECKKFRGRIEQGLTGVQMGSLRKFCHLYPERPIREASQGPLFTAQPKLNDHQALNNKESKMTRSSKALL